MHEVYATITLFIDQQNKLIFKETNFLCIAT